MIGVKIFGPVLGFALVSLCTSLYVDPFLEPDVTPKDPRKNKMNRLALASTTNENKLTLNLFVIVGYFRLD